MTEAASNANLLEFAKRLLAAFPGPAGPLFAENDPLDHFPGAQAPKPRLPARALWLKSDKLIPLAPPWSQRRSQTGSIMRPRWFYHGAKNEARFFIWLHGEASNEARLAPSRGQTGFTMRPQWHHLGLYWLHGGAKPYIYNIYSTLLYTSSYLRIAYIETVIFMDSKVKYFYLIFHSVLLTQAFMFSIMEVMKAESISGERRCDHGVRNNNGTDRINGR